MKAIIVAAGMGKRMGYLTQELPKSLAIQFNGKSLMEIQLETLKQCGVGSVSIVRGYKAEKISFPNVQYYFNDQFEKNNILESLFYAEEALEGNVIISYSDIWYEPEILSRLMMDKKDIVIGVDGDWQKNYLHKKTSLIEGAETVIFNRHKQVVKIGRNIAEKNSVHGEFIGLVKLSKRGCEMLKTHYHKAKSDFKHKPFHKAQAFQNAYLTDLFQEMVDQGVGISCEQVEGGWKEVDTLEDYQEAQAIVKRRNEGTLNE